MLNLELVELNGKYSILKLDSLPDVRVLDGFFSLTRTVDEISLVCRTADADKLHPYAREDGYAALRVVGRLDFSLVGILARMTGALASAGVPVCAVSTYDTDYLLIKSENMPSARTALEAIDNNDTVSFGFTQK